MGGRCQAPAALLPKLHLIKGTPHSLKLWEGSLLLLTRSLTPASDILYSCLFGGLPLLHQLKLVESIDIQEDIFG